MRRAVLIVLLSACTPLASPPTAATSPTPEASNTPPAISSTAAPTSSAPSVAFPDIPLVAASADGQIYVLRNGQWVSQAQVCPNGIATYSASIVGFRVSADGRRASFRCDAAGPPGQPVHGFVYDFTTKTAHEISGVTELGIGPISPDGRFVVLPAPGECPMPAPVCQTTASLLDLETQTRQVILPSDYWFLMEMSWTSFGLTYFRPECAPAGCTSADKAGTFRWDGSRWTKVSPYRVIDAVSEDHLLFESRRSIETEESSVTVIERIGASERLLTSAPPEYAVAIDALGVTTFRPSGQGAYVRYVNGRETGITPGTFSPYAFRHTRVGDWIVSVDSGPGVLTLWAYSLTQLTMASRRAGISIVALAGLP